MRYNVLSVDELGITRIELSNILKDFDLNIINVKDEIEAANTLNERKVNINIIVWTMNTIDSRNYEAIRRIKSIKSLETNKSIPIIIISKFTDKRYIIKAIEYGANEYVAKPYDEEAVKKKFCRLLGVKPETEKSPGRFIDEDLVTYNFPEMFTREIKSAGRGGYNLTIMMVSVMIEKSSHQGKNNSEEITSLINKIIKTRLRETDSSFIYGLDSLVLLLPFADKNGAGIVENKLQDIFASHSLIKQKNRGAYTLFTTSVTFPTDGKIKGRLLEKLEKNVDDYKNLGIKNL